MKRQVYNFISAVFLVLLLVDLIPVGAAAEDKTEDAKTVFYDCSDDQMSYGTQVAELIRQNGQAGAKGDTSSGAKRGEETGGQTLFVVLCRAEEEFEPDFAIWAPACVVAGPQNRYTLFFRSEKDAAAACEGLTKTEGIRYAEPDAEVTASGTETSFHSWGAARMNYGEYVDYTGQWGDGSVTVAVIDSGVSRHPLLTNRIMMGGHDYVDNDNDSTNDLKGHGTNVAGVVADCTPGAAVGIYPIRVLNANGSGTVSNVANAVLEAAGAGVQVMNLSLEGAEPGISSALDEAILDAVSAGVTVVIAAGNQGADTASYSPAHLTTAGAVVVGSVDADGGRSYFSNYGDSVDLYAPGRFIECASIEDDYSYKKVSGTSIAAPHISALSALLLLIHPGLSPAEIEQRMTLAAPETTVNIPDLVTIIPAKLGFHLNSLSLTVQDDIRFFARAHPETALEDITYSSSDESVLRVEDGRLIPVSPGTATVTASCTGFEDQVFTVSVGETGGGELVFPAQLRSLEDEAFSGATGFSRVSIPEGTQSIGDHVFDSCGELQSVSVPDSVSSIGENDFSGAVLLCGEDSTAEYFAVENNREYILLQEGETQR